MTFEANVSFLGMNVEKRTTNIEIQWVGKNPGRLKKPVAQTTGSIK